MSCHNIGRGMASVTEVVIDLYERKKIGKMAAKEIVAACGKGVHWCDGNESEAMESVIEAGYCGLCFKKTENLSSVYENDLKPPYRYNVLDAYRKNVLHDYLCPECRQKVLDKP